MDDKGYRDFLEREGLTGKAINSRVTRANRIEREFNLDLDVVIQSEQDMIEVRQMIYDVYGEKGSTPGNLYNAVAKYYKFKNGIEMRRITQLQR